MEITYNKVSHEYNSATYQKLKVLDDINLSIEANKITGIVGKQGSGKTTLVEMLEALVIPTKGNVKIDNFTIKKNKQIKKINELRKTMPRKTKIRIENIKEVGGTSSSRAMSEVSATPD